MRSLKYAAACVLLMCPAALSGGCAHEQQARPVAPAMPKVATTVTTAAPARTSNVSVSDELIKLCKLDFGNVGQAPKFDFDRSGLRNDDRAVLQQVATCVTTGPLKGRHLHLTGRADPRGEVEYNFALGEHRAGSVEQYLEHLGVATPQLSETSRGKLDATGKDETGWQRDRRVDVDLD